MLERQVLNLTVGEVTAEVLDVEVDDALVDVIAILVFVDAAHMNGRAFLREAEVGEQIGHLGRRAAALAALGGL